MILVCNRIPVNPEFAEQFEKRFSQRDRMVDGMPGFIAFQLLRPTKEDDPYIVQTFWEDRASFENWTSSDEFRQQHAQSGTLPEGAFLGHPKIEVHDIVQNTAQIVRAAESAE
jgi:heme oxygenase (mycobilin-producing)